MTAPSSADVLVVEDDRELAQLLQRLLTEEGFAVDVVGDGRRALNQALVRCYDLVVLDRSLPSLEGLEVMRAWRARGVRTPVLVLSARGAVPDRVEGLDAGAEDYLTKPFDVDELVARLRALLRRFPVARSRVGLPGGWELDTRTGTACRGDEEVVLTEREALFVRVLAEHGGQVISRDELQARVFPAAGTGNVVDTYVSTVRRKLGREMIATVYGVGFRLGG